MNLSFKSLEISLSAQEQEERQQLMARYEEVSLGTPTENTRDVFLLFYHGFIMVLAWFYHGFIIKLVAFYIIRVPICIRGSSTFNLL